MNWKRFCVFMCEEEDENREEEEKDKDEEPGGKFGRKEAFCC